MKNNDDLQYMPIMRGKIGYTDDEFKRTNIKNHGNKKGTVKWNYKKMVTTMILTSSVFAVSIGGVHAFKTMNGAPKEPVAVETQVDANTDIQVKEVKQQRVVVDYLVKSGDTLDGIIYKYTDSASEKDYYKNYVTYYNDIENDLIKAGQVLTLVGVPEEYANELNTGYDATVDNKDEISVQLNEAVQEMLDEVGEYSTGSLADTVVKELEVYNATTNSKTRSHLAKSMLSQIENIKDYGLAEDVNKGRSH